MDRIFIDTPAKKILKVLDLIGQVHNQVANYINYDLNLSPNPNQCSKCLNVAWISIDLCL